MLNKLIGLAIMLGTLVTLFGCATPSVTPTNSTVPEATPAMTTVVAPPTSIVPTRSQNPKVFISWVDFIKFNDIIYLSETNQNSSIPAEDLPEYAKVQFKTASVVNELGYKIKNGDAAFLEIGTPIYSIRDYSPQFRLVALAGGRQIFYEADTNPNAKVGADLLDLEGKVVYISINSRNDGTTELAAIRDAKQVSDLTQMILDAPVDQTVRQNGSDQYFLVFHLEDGTSVRRSFLLDTGELQRGIFLPDAFVQDIRSALTPSPSIGTQTSTDATAGPLSWLLQAAPAGDIVYLTYDDIEALSASQNQAIPSGAASLEEKTKWWTTFQNYVVASGAYYTVTDIFFDIVNLKGALTVWYQDQSSINISGGQLDLAALREMLKPYQYTEENYLGYPIFSRAQQPAVDTQPGWSKWLPPTFGIIEGVKNGGDTVSLILTASNSGDNDVSKARSTIQSALKAYQDKKTLAYQSTAITPLINSLGRVGSAFISQGTSLQAELESIKPEDRPSYIGTGKLDPYSQLAITFRKDGNDSILEFILGYDTDAIAQSNVTTLEKRLSEGRRSFTGQPVSEIWSVKEVKANGSFLHGAVKLIEQPDGKTLNFANMIFLKDYPFLSPN